jgi:hypothetical protein
MREHFDAFGQLAGVKITPVVKKKAPSEPGAQILSMRQRTVPPCGCC